jgi:hypothetical protein
VGAGKYSVSANGGSEPRWRNDGKELFYWSDSTLMASPVKLGTTPEIGAARRLFRKTRFSFTPELGGYTYNPSSDGQRFLISVPAGGLRGSLDLTVLMNPAQLK